MEPLTAEEIVELAQALLEKGEDPEFVNQVVRQAQAESGLGGDLVSALSSRVEAAELKRQEGVFTRSAERGTIASTAGMFAQGATLGLLPDFLNIIGQEAKAEDFRTFVEETREAQPLASRPNGAFRGRSRNHAPLAGQAARPQLLLPFDAR